MICLRKLGLVTLGLTVWIAGSAPSVRAQDPGRLLQEPVDVLGHTATVYSTLVGVADGSSDVEGGGFLFPSLMIVILFACVACLYTEGTWGNALRLINVVTAALLATNFFEPAAEMLDGWFETFTYLWDFLALWGLFAIFMVLFRLATDYLSRVKVRLLRVADRIGSVVLALAIGWVMICFTAMSLHAAPLARNHLLGSFDPDSEMFFGLAPDRQWGRFVYKMSERGFVRSATKSFDPKRFKDDYATRRENLEWQIEETGKLRKLR